MIFKTQRFSKSPFMLNKKPTPKPYAFFSMHGLGVDVQSFKNGIMTHANQISPQPAIVPCGFASNNQTAAIDIPAQRVYKAAAAGVATYLSHSAPAAFFVSPHPISGYMGPSSPEGQFFPTGVMLVPILLLPYVSVSPYGMQASQDGCSLPGPVQHAQSDPNLQIQEYGSGSASSTGDSSPNSHAKAKMQLKRFWNNWWSMLGHRPDNQIWVAEELNGFQQEVKQILQQPDLSIERFSVQEKINLSEQLADFLNLVIDKQQTLGLNSEPEFFCTVIKQCMPGFLAKSKNQHDVAQQGIVLEKILKLLQHEHMGSLDEKIAILEPIVTSSHVLFNPNIFSQVCHFYAGLQKDKIVLSTLKTFVNHFLSNDRPLKTVSSVLLLMSSFQHVAKDNLIRGVLLKIKNLLYSIDVRGYEPNHLALALKMFRYLEYCVVKQEILEKLLRTISDEHFVQLSPNQLSRSMLGLANMWPQTDSNEKPFLNKLTHWFVSQFSALKTETFTATDWICVHWGLGKIPAVTLNNILNIFERRLTNTKMNESLFDDWDGTHQILPHHVFAEIVHSMHGQNSQKIFRDGDSSVLIKYFNTWVHFLSLQHVEHISALLKTQSEILKDVQSLSAWSFKMLHPELSFDDSSKTIHLNLKGLSHTLAIRHVSHAIKSCPKPNQQAIELVINFDNGVERADNDKAMMMMLEHEINALQRTCTDKFISLSFKELNKGTAQISIQNKK